MFSQRKPIDVNEGLLNAWAIDTALFRQPCSHDTLIHQIKVLPKGASIIASRSEFRVVYRTDNEVSAETYETALKAALTSCLQTIVTLHEAKGVSLSVPLSGGLDSRTVFSMFEWLRNSDEMRSGRQFFKINSDTNPEAAEDYAIASMITNARGLELNGNPNPSPSVQMTPKDAVEAWRVNFLGIHGQ